MWREISDKALPDRVYAILCCCPQSVFHDGGRGSHRKSMVGRCTRVWFFSLDVVVCMPSGQMLKHCL